MVKDDGEDIRVELEKGVWVIEEHKLTIIVKEYDCYRGGWCYRVNKVSFRVKKNLFSYIV